MHETIFGYSMNIIFIMIHQSQKVLKNWPCAAVILLRVGYYKIQIQHNLNWVGGNIRTPWFIGYPLYFHKKIQEILPEETWMRNDRNKRQKSSNCLIPHLSLQQHYLSLLTLEVMKQKSQNMPLTINSPYISG